MRWNNCNRNNHLPAVKSNSRGPVHFPPPNLHKTCFQLTAPHTVHFACYKASALHLQNPEELAPEVIQSSLALCIEGPTLVALRCQQACFVPGRSLQPGTAEALSPLGISFESRSSEQKIPATASSTYSHVSASSAAVFGSLWISSSLLDC